MQYYFEEKFEFDRDYFNLTELTEDLRDQVILFVEDYLNFVEYDRSLYSYWKRETVDKIDVDYSWGVFYYNRLNSFFREIENVVWNGEFYSAETKTLREKDRFKRADKAKKNFFNHMKEMYP